MTRDEAVARLRELWRADPGGRSFPAWLKAHGLPGLARLEARRQLARSGP